MKNPSILYTLDYNNYTNAGPAIENRVPLLQPSHCCGAYQLQNKEDFLDFVKGFSFYISTNPADEISEEELILCKEKSDVDIFKIKEYTFFLRKNTRTKNPSGGYVYTQVDPQHDYSLVYHKLMINGSYLIGNTIPGILSVYYTNFKIFNAVNILQDRLENGDVLLFILNTHTQKLPKKLEKYIRYKTGPYQNGGYPDMEPALDFYVVAKDFNDFKLEKQYV